eukprot:963943-Prymnesium_polylepis.1
MHESYALGKLCSDAQAAMASAIGKPVWSQASSELGGSHGERGSGLLSPEHWCIKYEYRLEL